MHKAEELGQGDTRPVVVITGCSDGGIGAALCKAFAEKSCRVFATARRLDAMNELQGPGWGLEVLELDVTKPESITAAVDTVIQKAGRIDILINNAGMGLFAPMAEVPLDRFRSLLEVNLVGPLQVIQAVVPHMVSQRSGKIVNIGSISGWHSFPFGGCYCASKSALHSFTNSLRMEVKPFGVQVMLVFPGAIKSNFSANAMRECPTDSLHIYQSYKDAIEEQVRYSAEQPATPATELADKLVKKTLQKQMPRTFSYGKLVTIFRFIYVWPLWYKEHLFMKKCGLLASHPSTSHTH